MSKLPFSGKEADALRRYKGSPYAINNFLTGKHQSVDTGDYPLEALVEDIFALVESMTPTQNDTIVWRGTSLNYYPELKDLSEKAIGKCIDMPLLVSTSYSEDQGPVFAAQIFAAQNDEKCIFKINLPAGTPVHDRFPNVFTDVDSINLDDDEEEVLLAPANVVVNNISTFSKTEFGEDDFGNEVEHVLTYTLIEVDYGQPLNIYELIINALVKMAKKFPNKVSRINAIVADLTEKRRYGTISAEDGIETETGANPEAEMSV